MKLEEALVHLREGKKIRKEGWKIYEYIFINEENLVGETGLPVYIDLNINLMESDWEIFEPIQKPMVENLQEKTHKDILLCSLEEKVEKIEVEFNSLMNLLQVKMHFLEQGLYKINDIILDKDLK